MHTDHLAKDTYISFINQLLMNTSSILCSLPCLLLQRGNGSA